MSRREIVDQFDRTPTRRYDLPPDEQPVQASSGESRAQHDIRFRRRHFDFPKPDFRPARALCVVLSLALAAVLCNASAPLTAVPDVQARFDDWAAAHNEKTVKSLPGNTPEPGSALYEAVHFEPQAQQLALQSTTPAPAAQQRGEQTTNSAFKHYEPGELFYQNDHIRVSIEQKQKDGMTYFACDIQLSDVSQMRTAFAGDSFTSGIYEAVSDIAGRYDPVLAINADYCRYHRDGVIIRNGEVLRRQNIRLHHLLIVDEHGDLSALTDRSGKQGLVANDLEQKNTWQTFEFGPVLVRGGEACTLPSSFYIRTADGYDEPRTAIGQIGPLHYIVIVVDGRREGYSTGASLPQLQQLFLDEGAQFAFNLDGGGSTTLYFLGSVVNMPSSGAQRPVSDVIMFMPNPQA